MQDKKKDKDKIKLSRIIKNVFYVIGFSMREDKLMVLGFMAAYILFSVGNAVFDTYLLKITIDMLSDDTPLLTLIAVVLAGFLILGLAVAVQNIAENVMQTRLVKVTGNIQRSFIKKASDMDLICYDRKEYFDDFVIAASQCDEMIQSGIVCTTYIIGNVLGIITAASIIFTIDPIIAIFPVLGFIINIITRFAITKLEYRYEMEKKRINRKSDYSKRVFYQPEYAKEIKLSGIAEPLRRQFNEAIDEEKKMAKGYGVKIAVLSLINWIFVFTFLSYFCLPAYLGYLAIVKMSIKLGDVAATNNAANSVRNRLDATNYALVEFQKVGQFAERFRRFIDYKENIETFKGVKPVPEDSTVEIKNMSYRYDGNENYTLKNINITIHPGEKIAIVGENGAGKSTLIKLLMRLYDVTDGSITYGGTDIRELSTHEYREKIGAVFQDYQIYAATLAENVVMSNDVENNRDNIKAALGLADFSGKLTKLADGLDTEMTKEFSEKGTMLSGGESQKVAVSRMFAKKNELSVAILDEPSSALDPVAEYTLNTNMIESAKNSSVIFISHRLSTTREAEHIYMFENGGVIEEGTHDQLMALNGKYAEMFEKQAHYYKLKLDNA